jgi:hypothetical protein
MMGGKVTGELVLGCSHGLTVNGERNFGGERVEASSEDPLIAFPGNAGGRFELRSLDKIKRRLDIWQPVRDYVASSHFQHRYAYRWNIVIAPTGGVLLA